MCSGRPSDVGWSWVPQLYLAMRAADPRQTRPSCLRASPLGTPDAGLLEGDPDHNVKMPVFPAHGFPGDQAPKLIPTALLISTNDMSSLDSLFLTASARFRHDQMGASQAGRCLSSTTGCRTKKSAWAKIGGQSEW